MPTIVRPSLGQHDPNPKDFEYIPNTTCSWIL